PYPGQHITIFKEQQPDFQHILLGARKNSDNNNDYTNASDIKLVDNVGGFFVDSVDPSKT
ncbi:hypothetical protein MBANPS3_012476, partial [Mucor bainieri]